MLAADFNGDGHVDICQGLDHAYIRIFYGNGVGGFTLGSSGWGMNAIDLNSDGRLDLIGVVPQWPEGSGTGYFLRAHLNLDSGGQVTWNSVGPIAPLSGDPNRAQAFLSNSAADIDGNGYIDQAVFFANGRVSIYMGSSSGGQLVWTEQQIAQLPTTDFIDQPSIGFRT